MTGRRSAWLWVCAALALGGCGDKSDPKDPCAQGICAADTDGGMTNAGSGGGSAGTQGGGGASGSGTSGDGGTSTAGDGGVGNAGSGGTGGTGGVPASCDPGASCQPQWLCTPWESTWTGNDPDWTMNTSDHAGKRTCTDLCNCGTSTGKPAETATLPQLDRDFYTCSVEPRLDQFCAQLGCHGTEQGRALRTYARGRLRVNETRKFTGCLKTNVDVDMTTCIGSVECACWMLPHSLTEWQRNYDSARGFALDAQGNALGNPDDSELLQQPKVSGSYAHAGIHIWSPGKNGHDAVQSWLNGTGTGCGNAAMKNN